MAEFAEVTKIGSLLRDLPCPWVVCGGWALDLFLGRVTRPHKDVDVAVARADQLVVRDYLLGRGWALERAEGGELIPWPDGVRKDMRPRARVTDWSRLNLNPPPSISLSSTSKKSGSWLSLLHQTAWDGSSSRSPSAQGISSPPSALSSVQPRPSR